MANYRIRQSELSSDSDDFQQYLEDAHSEKVRPLCLCQGEPVEMYLARFDGRFLIKRMPGTGSKHDSACEHFEPPAGLSGLGDVLGRAIQPQTDGTTALRFDFSLSKAAGRTPPKPSDNPSPTIKVDNSKLSLLGLLHFLWHEADIHRWIPAFSGKRSWRTVRNRLIEAATQKTSRKMPLMDRLLVPEAFSADHADEIDKRRNGFLSRFRTGDPRKRELILIVGEVKEIGASRYGSRITVKHAPKFSVFLDDKTHERLRKRFATEFALSEAYEHSHLMMIATASVNEANSAIVEEIGLMLVNENWIPCETLEEYSLIDDLTTQRRSFLKGLRFEVRDKPLASALLTDLKPPVGLYLLYPDSDIIHSDIIEELSAETKIPAWKWVIEDGPWPELPAAQSRKD